MACSTAGTKVMIDWLIDWRITQSCVSKFHEVPYAVYVKELHFFSRKKWKCISWFLDVVLIFAAQNWTVDQQLWHALYKKRCLQLFRCKQVTDKLLTGQVQHLGISSGLLVILDGECHADRRMHCVSIIQQLLITCQTRQSLSSASYFYCITVFVVVGKIPLVIWKTRPQHLQHLYRFIMYVYQCAWRTGAMNECWHSNNKSLGGRQQIKLMQSSGE